MPRGTKNVEDTLARINEALERVQKRREARRTKYVDADARDIEREREFREAAVRLQVTVDHNKELDAKIADELAKLNGDDDDASGKGLFSDDTEDAPNVAEGVAVNDDNPTWDHS